MIGSEKKCIEIVSTEVRMSLNNAFKKTARHRKQNKTKNYYMINVHV